MKTIVQQMVEEFQSKGINLHMVLDHESELSPTDEVCFIMIESDEARRFCNGIMSAFNVTENLEYWIQGGKLIDEQSVIYLYIPWSRSKLKEDYIDIYNEVLSKMDQMEDGYPVDTLLVYTDGASRGNPGKSAWGVYIPQAGLAEAGYYQESTNNAMELRGILEALIRLSLMENPKWEKVCIHTDSAYALNTVTKWAYGWMKNGILQEKKNWELVRDIMFLIKLLRSDGWNIEFEKVEGHAGIEGNERADGLCNQAMDNEKDATVFPNRSYSQMEYYLELAGGFKFTIEKFNGSELVVKGIPNWQFIDVLKTKLNNIQTLANIYNIKLEVK
jgi:ribonuclease HI